MLVWVCGGHRRESARWRFGQWNGWVVEDSMRMSVRGSWLVSDCWSFSARMHEA